MKKSFCLGLVAFLSLVSCTRNREIDIKENDLTLFARTESPADTKTVVESGAHVFWEPGDEIAVFMGEKSAKFTTDITAASGTATFQGTFGEETWPEEIDLWAVYPFSEDAVFDGEIITATLPSEQIAREGSFGKNMNLSIAHSNSATLQFYNVGGGIRFSVLEEGIKKVMFEGLSGEIISGKVKIGFDDGVPVVKEVTSGSQFISLLPPAGKETFNPGVWYYIVAIPGSLEGGYKLRFYRDSDYARKVSEKAVMIKRSIYGNLEKADERIDYEAQTTHFPETMEEIKESAKALSVINHEVWGVLDGIKEANPSILNEIKNVEGVLEVITDPSQKTISVMQKDSVWVNYFLDTENLDYPVSWDDADEHQFYSRKRAPYKAESSPRDASDPLQSGNVVFNKKRKAVILAPYKFNYDLNAFRNTLINAGIGVQDEDVVVKKEGTDAFSISDFYGSNLCKYDVIMIVSHGGIGCNVFHDYDMPLATIICLNIPYSDDIAEELIQSGEVPFDRIAYSGEKDGLSFAMTADYLGNASFDNACVFLMTCHSAERLDDEGSLVKAFLDRKAGLVSGNNRTVAPCVTSRANLKIAYLMSKGLSFQRAFRQIEESDYLDDFCNYWHEYMIRENNEDLPWENYDVARFYTIRENDSLNGKEYFLVDPFPSLNEPVPQEDGVLFSWNCRLRPFDDNWYYPDPSTFSGYLEPYPADTYTVEYDVFVSGQPLPKSSVDPNGRTAFWPASPAPNGYDWFVVAKLLKDDTIIASYQSETGHFTVADNSNYEVPEAIDLGLSVKWASFNLGASRMSGVGRFFAWGETEPKNDYSVSAYQWCQGSESALTKYCSHSKYGFNGFTDNKDVLDLEDDAAHVHLDGDWRMPTYDEWQELFKKCTAEWTNMEGVDGLKFTSKVSGYTDKWIFIPASGYMYGSTLYGANYGFCWSSSVCVLYQDPYAYAFTLSTSGTANQMQYRYLGFPVRPVCDESLMFVPVTGVSLDRTSVCLETGETVALTATVQPADATNRNVRWSSSKPSVATVDAEGVVSAIGDGSARITVTTEDGGMTASCQVTVTTYVPVESISLNRTSVSLVKGESLTLTATVSPSNATDKTLSWRSEDPSVATVDNGRLTALKAGNTIVHVTHVTRAGQTIEAVCSVVVKQAGGSLEGTGEEEWP